MAKLPKVERARRPRLFVGSSVEGLPVAYAIQENLQHDAEVTVWPQGVFDLSKSSLQSLVAQLNRSDYGAFVFTPDDEVRLRAKRHKAVRDNVLFELGLFTGKLTPDRVFAVAPEHADLHVPTDLMGTTLGSYDPNREDDNLTAALGPFCNRVRAAMSKGRLATPAGKRKKQARRAGQASRVRGVTIHSARYGVGRSRVDVKAPLVRALKQFGYVRVGNDLAGDPRPGVLKVLKLDFSYAGTRRQVLIPEGGTLAFPPRSK